ncbi:MAG: YdcF family protein [Gemmatimonadota bacterium]|nr:YdcF family protein [Gemmatimonadota bacterium]
MRGYHADAIVVLGSTVNDDGSLPLHARQRAVRAAMLYAAGVAPYIIFSGRCNLTAPEPPAVSEAAAMAAYAESLGSPRDAILLEEESRDTIGNAYFVGRRFLEPNGWSSIRVVTSDFHVPRTTWVFQKVLGSAYDVSFSPASTELDATVIAARARAEGDIVTFLMEWIGPIAEGDHDAVDRFIHQEHPGYAANPAVSREEIQERVNEIARVHRVVETHGLEGHRTKRERDVKL